MDLPQGIYRVNISIPISLKNINCYLLEGSKGWSVIDTGLDYPKAREEWENALLAMGIAFSDIRDIIVTHGHIDHIGLAGWIQQQSGCRVLMSSREALNVEKYSATYSQPDSALADFLFKSGYTIEDASALRAIFSSVDQIVKPEPRTDELADGDTIILGDRSWRVLITPGHAEGHVCLYDPNEEILISGDQLLPTITSNISLLPTSVQNPLEQYISSLIHLKELKIKTVLPAHGEPFTEAHKRIDELFAHHSERLRIILDSVGEGKDAVKIADLVFGSDLHNPIDRFLAVGEILAHLKVLIKCGLVVEHSGTPVIYTLASNAKK